MRNLLIRAWRPTLLLTVGLALGVSAILGVHASESQAGKDSKDVDAQLHASLRQIINQGADLYNRSQDYGGSYYTFKGSLVTIRPLLDHHPDLQKLIDKSLQDAEKEPRMWQRALVLRDTLESVRTKIDPNPTKPGEEKKTPEEKKPGGDKKDAGKDKDKVEPKKDDGMARVFGKVTYQDKPVVAGFVTFVAKDGRTYSANLTANGTYAIKKHGLPPGAYIVVIDPPVSGDPQAGMVPIRYRSPNTSDLNVILQAGEGKHDIPLQ